MEKETERWGTSSFILSILSLLFFFAPYVGIVFGILAIVFYNKQNKIRLTGFATAGLIIGVVGIVINAIFLAMMLGVAGLLLRYLFSAR